VDSNDPTSLPQLGQVVPPGLNGVAQSGQMICPEAIRFPRCDPRGVVERRSFRRRWAGNSSEMLAHVVSGWNLEMLSGRQIATRPGRPVPGQDSHLLDQRAFAHGTPGPAHPVSDRQGGQQLVVIRALCLCFLHLQLPKMEGHSPGFLLPTLLVRGRCGFFRDDRTVNRDESSIHDRDSR
jgi:hypothetical protein